jgi:hypothetical protein
MLQSRLISAIWLLLLLHADARAGERQTGWCRRLWSWMTVCCDRTFRDHAKSACRGCVENAFPKSRRPVYGLRTLDRIRTRDRLVIFLHGLNSRPEDMDSLIQEVRKSGLPCAVYRYPNDQPIIDSVDLFAGRVYTSAIPA